MNAKEDVRGGEKDTHRGVSGFLRRIVVQGTSEGLVKVIGAIIAAIILALLAHFGLHIGETPQPNNGNNIPTNNVSNNVTSNNCSTSDSPNAVQSSFTLYVGQSSYDTVFRSGHAITLSDDRNYVYVGNNYNGYWEDEGYQYIGDFEPGRWNIVHTFNNVGEGAFSVCKSADGTLHGAVVEW